MKKRAARRPSSGRRQEKLSVISLLFLVFYTALATYFGYLVVTHHLFDTQKTAFHLLGGLIGIFLLSLFLWLLKKATVFTQIFLFLASLCLLGGIFVGRSAINLANQFNQTTKIAQTNLAVAVSKDSPLTDLSGVTSLLGAANDQAGLSDLLVQLQEAQLPSPATEMVSSYQVAYEQILADGQKAMVLNDAYVPLLEAIDDQFADKIKVIYTTKVEKAVERAPKAEEVKETADSFNIYISGIDSHGSISTISRSDVNIIMTVNRRTKKILLTTTPRDAYVPIAGGGAGQPDKLTHAGIYGVDASIGTLENLYGIKLDYYARLNFTSFIHLIDLVGGIEVVNDQEFTSLYGGYHFPVGTVSLNSDQALGFVRERYSLQDGDYDRGKNQQKVIAALIDKLASVNSLSSYNALIDGLGTSVQTDMPLSEMLALANGQLASKSKYQVTSQAVSGTGSIGQLPSYAMPEAALYMVSLDQASLEAAKQAIYDTMEGN